MREHRKPEAKRTTVERASLCCESLLAELVFGQSLEAHLQFAVCESSTVTIRSSVTVKGQEVAPPRDPHRLVEKGVVLLASGVSPYGSQAQLVGELQAYIHRYADLPPFWEELVTTYALMTWVYDRFSAVPYLRFLGEPQTGKSRLLQVVGHLCYKAIIAGGSTTASPLFRLLELYSGTFVADEADFKNSEAWSEIIKILNCGYMRGLPVLRSEKVGDTYEPRAFDVFGPKIIANRSRFDDPALESRCLTLETSERKMRTDIPRQLPPAFTSEAVLLRNKLLQWRFDNYQRIQVDESRLLDLEPRLTQIGTPIFSVSNDANFRSRFLEFLGECGVKDRAQRPQALVVEAIQKLAQNNGHLLGIKEVAEEASTLGRYSGEFLAFNPKRVGALVRSLGFNSRRTNEGYKFEVDRQHLEELVQKY